MEFIIITLFSLLKVKECIAWSLILKNVAVFPVFESIDIVLINKLFDLTLDIKYLLTATTLINDYLDLF